MSKRVRTEDAVGPNHDKHALVVDNYREVHRGPSASECVACRETVRMSKRGKK
jgi:hypothetical protein